ncbi:MAG: dienelactone hydrolase family protein [Rhodoferax sp.]
MNVLVLPDWRGWQTDCAARRGQELHRALGCNVVVSDLYGTAYRPRSYAADAERWVQHALSDPVTLRRTLRSYLGSLAEKLGTQPQKMAVVGYCLGGALSFEMGRSDCAVAAVACVHGIPSTQVPITHLAANTRFLAIHGASDPIIGMDQLTAFQHEMTAAQVDWLSVALGHARHGFTDEDADPQGQWQRYDAVAAGRTLHVLQAWLSESGGRP